jgi:hypothetical protein
MDLDFDPDVTDASSEGGTSGERDETGQGRRSP